MSDNAPTDVSRQRLSPAWLLIPGTLGALIWLGIVLIAPPSVAPIEQARLALEQGRLDQARSLTDQVLETQPRSTAGMLLAAQIAVAQGRYQEAVRFCESIPVDLSRESIESEVLCGEVLLENLRLISPAEARFRRVLRRAPDHPFALDRLVYLLSLETRDRDLVPFQLSLIRAGHISPQRIYSLVLGHRIYPDLELLREFHDADPVASGPLLARARIAIKDGDLQHAQELLREIVINTPDNLEAHARLGEVIMDRQDSAALRTWAHALPFFALEHPGVCEALGRMAVLQGDDRSAARYYWEALRLDPNLPVSNYQLAQCLVRSGHPEDGEAFLNRGALLEEYTQLVDRRSQDSDLVDIDALLCRQASVLCRELNLIWEEFAWLMLAADSDPLLPHETERVEQLYAEVQSLPLRRIGNSISPAAGIDLSNWPLPDLTESGSLNPFGRSISDATPALRFAETAEQVGIEFEFYNDADPAVRGMGRAFDFTGGGVAAADFDGDMWPDIYLAQGAVIPPATTGAVHLDRVYRNTGHGRYVDVTAQATLHEDRYSQGVAVGDVDDDGFPDVFVCNLGPNRLFLNNGDGTFSDMSWTLEEREARWTTSAAIVDLNGDGLSEIYAVNYLTAPDLLTRICRDQSQALAPCTPRDFEGAVDALYWNRGDGSWSDVARPAGVALSNGKGLGILAADFDGNGRVELFVANDGVANFFFRNVGADPLASPQFQEQAMQAGLAFNELGRAEACMGILADDFNDDDLIDLFVTNFYDESNTLYRQQRGLLFQDATRAAGLHEASFKQLGFGTQVVDVQLDGRSEIFVTNGHVDDYTSAGIPYEMSPQLLRNVSTDAHDPLFEAVADDESGAYFGNRYLGRAVARLDWNRDGRDDMVVTHLDAPAALLTNDTEPYGRFVRILLRGTVSGRDALGTQVTVATGSHQRTRQLIAGDGYQCTNERALVFGLGSADQPVRIDVQWTSGRQQTIDDVGLDQTVIVVEGRSGVFAVPHPESAWHPPVTE